MVDDLHSAVSSRLRRVEQRYTTGRRILVEVLADTERPLTAAELVGARPGLPQSTTYRNLAILEQAGVARRVIGTDEFARYELAEELTGHHHHHLVCVRCGSVEDFEPPGRVEQSLADAIGQLETSSGFRAESHRLDLLGTCGACAPI